MSLVAFLLAQESIVLAGVMSAAVAVGMISSRFLRGMHPRPMSFLMTIARAAAVFAAYQDAFTVAILCAAVAGLSSRRLLLDLKHQVGDIDPRHLVTHGTLNSVLFGVGAAAAGFLLPSPAVAQLVAISVAIAAMVAYPDADRHDVEEAAGLTRRDVVAAIVFTFASTPLTNAIAPALLIGVVGSEVAGFSCLAYTLGSLLAPKLTRGLLRFTKPVAVATTVAAATFAVTILFPEPLVVHLTRFAAGAFLYAGHGIMEMRTQRAGDGKGLEYLWSLISGAGVIANIAVPVTVESTSLWAAPLWTLLGAVIIGNLSRIPQLR